MHYCCSLKEFFFKKAQKRNTYVPGKIKARSLLPILWEPISPTTNQDTDGDSHATAECQGMCVTCRLHNKMLQPQSSVVTSGRRDSRTQDCPAEARSTRPPAAKPFNAHMQASARGFLSGRWLIWERLVPSSLRVALEAQAGLAFCNGHPCGQSSG